MANQRLKSLNEIATGKSCIVRQLRGGREFLSRMATMGFTVGAEIVVIQNYKRGPLITMIRETRIALGRGEALKVIVEETNEQA